MLSKICKILFGLHFSVLFIYLTGSLEILPAKCRAYTQWTTHYIDPFFEQDWGMFAPVPPSSNLHVFMQYRTVKGGQATTSPWYDVYSPILTQNQSSFFSLNQRLMKYFHGATMNVYKAKNTLTDTSAAAANQAVTHSYGYKSLRNYAKIVLSNKGGLTATGDTTYLKIKFINDYFPPYAKRAEDYQNNKEYEHSVLETDFNKI